MIGIEEEIRGRVLSQSLWKAKEEDVTLLSLGRSKEHTGSFLPCFQLHELKSQVRFNASFLRPRTKSLFVPQWNLSLWRAAQLPVRYSPADVPWETRLAVPPSPRVQEEWALCTVGWKWHSLLWSPLGFPSGQNFLLQRRGCGQWMCVWFCFVPLWLF